MDIGFIGLGHMGQEMARSLLKAGFRLTVYNRTRARAEALRAEGATVAESPAEASGGDLAITMLADDPAVEAVVFGEEGVIGGLRKGAIHAGMSTITVALSKRLADAHQAAGQHYVAGPVFGRPEAAAAGKLFIVAAGEPEPVARCQPIRRLGTENVRRGHGADRRQSDQALRKFPDRLDDRGPWRDHDADPQIRW